MQTIHLRGLLFETADTDEINYRKRLRDAMLQSIGSSRFALYHHIVRRRIDVELSADYRDDFSRRLDSAWRARLAAKKLYVNELFLTLVRRPLQGRVGGLDRLRGKLRRGEAEVAAGAAYELRQLETARDALIAALGSYEPRLLGVYQTRQGACSEPLEFLAALYNGEMRPVLLPMQDLGAYLPYRRVSFGQETVELGPAGPAPRSFLGLVSIKDYPGQTAPGMLDELLRLPFELVVSQSFGFVERQAALSRMNLALRRMRSAEDEAVSLRADLSTAKDEVAAGRAGFGEHHMTIAVRGDTPAAVDEGVAEVQAALADLGIIAVREEIDLEPAFWAQFPGNFKYIARRGLISTANFAGSGERPQLPARPGARQSLGRGHHPARDDRGGALLFQLPPGRPRQFHRHRPVRLGQDGGAELPARPGAQVAAEDHLLRQGPRRRAVHPGDRRALRPASRRHPVGPQPAPARRTIRSTARFLIDWLAMLAGGADIDEMARIKDAVDANYGQPAEHRRLRHLAELFRGGQRPHGADLWSRLKPWWGEGERAWLFDNPVDLTDLSAESVGFDMTQILDDPAMRTPAMMYLFHRVEERLDGSAAIIVVDEGWKALDDDVFVRRIKDWEKTIRKRNGIVGFATQSAQDALESRIASAIIEQAATQIFMANPKARADDYIEGFGLTPHEFELIRTLPDSAHCFLIKHGADSVVARLNLTGERDLLTILSGRERTVRLLDEIRAERGDDPADWIPRLLEVA